jgi:hypothetical protein
MQQKCRIYKCIREIIERKNVCCRFALNSFDYGSLQEKYILLIYLIHFLFFSVCALEATVCALEAIEMFQQIWNISPFAYSVPFLWSVMPLDSTYCNITVVCKCFNLILYQDNTRAT